MFNIVSPLQLQYYGNNFKWHKADQHDALIKKKKKNHHVTAKSKYSNIIGQFLSQAHGGQTNLPSILHHCFSQIVSIVITTFLVIYDVIETSHF